MAPRRERGLFDPDAAPGKSPFDHHIYVIASDGDLRRASPARPPRSPATRSSATSSSIYDDNQISIEDDTDIAFTEDVATRYEAYGWHVAGRSTGRTTGDGYVEDVDALLAAIEAAKAVTDKPSFIVLHTIIGWPAPTKQNTGKAHGSALGDDEVAATKQLLGFDPEQTFEVERRGPRAHPRGRRARRSRARRVAARRSTPGAPPTPSAPRCSTALRRRQLPDGLDRRRCRPSPPTPRASRPAPRPARCSTPSPTCIPELWGGSADLAESQQHDDGGRAVLHPDRTGRPTTGRATPTAARCTSASASTPWASILNGIALHGLTRPYGGTFLVFSDYMRPAVRLAALMKLPVIYVWTHDSIGLGEDGPTHQPIEHLAALRAIPGLDVVRPADANETAVAWRTILEHTDRPAGLALTRQNLPVVDRDRRLHASAEGVAKGAYVLAEAAGGTPT